MEPERSWQRFLIVSRVPRAVSGEGLRARAVRSSGWTLIGFSMNQVLRLGSNLILTRLLFPEAFGLMALAAVFMTGLEMFSDVGIRPAIIQNKRGLDSSFLNTAWTIQILRGFILWAIACVIALPISRVYDAPVLFPLLCVIGSTAAIRGFQTTGYATINRKMLLGRVTIVELCTQACGIIAMITWAAISPTIWALAGGGVVSSVASVAVAHRFLGTHKHRLEWNSLCFNEIMRFGKWIVASSVITFVGQSGDRILLPQLLSIRELAFYSIAMMLAQLPSRVIGQLSSKVLFPAYSKMHQEHGHERIRAACQKFTRASTLFYAVPLGMIFFGSGLIDVLYDDRYAPAGPAIAILSISAYFRMMRSSQESILLAVGESRYLMVVNLTRLSVWILLCLPLSFTWGLEGFCAAIATADGLTLLVQRYFVNRAVPGVRVGGDILILLILFVAVVLASIMM